MSEIISIVNQKGGVGKTTTTVNLGACLASNGKRVVLVDLDPKDHIALSFGFSRYDVRAGWYQLLVKKDEQAPAIHSTELENLDFIPANRWSENEDEDKDEVECSLTEMNQYLNDLMLMLRTKYDFILIDCPPSLGMLTISALTISDSLIVPIQCEFYALKSLGKLLKLVQMIKEEYNPKLQYRGFLLTMVDLRSNNFIRLSDKFRCSLEGMVLETMIPRNTRLAECPFYGEPIIRVDKNCKGAHSYVKLATELLHQDGTVASSLAKNELLLTQSFH